VLPLGWKMSGDIPFYVYVYRDPVTREPVYVGKGKGSRAISHTWNKARTNSRLGNMISARSAQGLTVEPEIVAHTNEENAFLVEQALIKYFGRADLGQGPLFNNTDGGDGVSNPNEKVRAQQSDAQYRRWGGRSVFEFVNAFTGEEFNGTAVELSKHIGVNQRAVHKLMGDVTVNSVAGWTLKGNELKINRYRHSYNFCNAMSGAEFSGTISEFSEAHKISLSLVSMLINDQVRHASGWVLSGREKGLRPLEYDSLGHVRELQFPWENARATETSLAAWALARDMYDYWKSEFSGDKRVGGKKVIKAMGIDAGRSDFLYERVFKRVRDGEIDVLNNSFYEEFRKSYVSKFLVNSSKDAG
jgi:hypothetical protein